MKTVMWVGVPPKSLAKENIPVIVPGEGNVIIGALVMMRPFVSFNHTQCVGVNWSGEVTLNEMWRNGGFLQEIAESHFTEKMKGLRYCSQCTDDAIRRLARE